MEADFVAENHGSVILFTALTDAARREIDVMDLADWQFVGEDSFAIDHGIAGDFAEALVANGFTIQ
jgi:hypothetical protein